MYSKVGRLFIKAQKKQVVWVAGVMREEGITVDKVMDLVIEKVRGGVTKKNGRQPQSLYQSNSTPRRRILYSL